MSTTVTLAGDPVAVGGDFPRTGDKAPSFMLVDKDLKDVALSNFYGKRKILDIAPSLDTSVCQATVRRFNAEVPQIWQWDDHEVTNNWYWELRKDRDTRYREGSVALLAARALRAAARELPVGGFPRHRLRRVRTRTSAGGMASISASSQFSNS